MAWEASWYTADKWKSQRASLSLLVNLSWPNLARKAPACGTLQWVKDGAFKHKFCIKTEQWRSLLLLHSCTFSCFWNEEPMCPGVKRYRLDDLRTSFLRPQCGHMHPVKIPKSAQCISSIHLEMFVHTINTDQRIFLYRLICHCTAWLYSRVRHMVPNWNAPLGHLPDPGFFHCRLKSAANRLSWVIGIPGSKVIDSLIR